MKRILVPTDFSSCADNAFDYALQLAKEISSELILIHIIDGNPTSYVGITGPEINVIELMKEQAEAQLLAKKNACRPTMALPSKPSYPTVRYRRVFLSWPLLSTQI